VIGQCCNFHGINSTVEKYEIFFSNFSRLRHLGNTHTLEGFHWKFKLPKIKATLSLKSVFLFFQERIDSMTEEDLRASFKEMCRSQPSYVLNISDKCRVESGPQPDRQTHNPPAWCVCTYCREMVRYNNTFHCLQRSEVELIYLMI
jgi:hypothetical protein